MTLQDIVALVNLCAVLVLLPFWKWMSNWRGEVKTLNTKFDEAQQATNMHRQKIEMTTDSAGKMLEKVIKDFDEHAGFKSHHVRYQDIQRIERTLDAIARAMPNVTFDPDKTKT